MKDRQRLMGMGLSVLLAQLAGGVGSIFTVASIPNWYVFLSKPVWNPPNWLFGPVWIGLYTLMGISAYLVWEKREKGGAGGVLLVYLFHLGINALWSMVFFGWKDLLLAYGVIVVLWLLISYLVVNFRKYNKWASYLLVPYLLWVSFASMLNLAIWILNRGI